MNMNQQQFKTSDFYLSVFLLCRGLRLIDLDRANPRRVSFVFQAAPRLAEMVQEFSFGEEALVDARSFAAAVKELKNKLYG